VWILPHSLPKYKRRNSGVLDRPSPICYLVKPTKMKPQTVAALLLLLVCTMVSPHPVVGGNKRPRCTEEDKAHVLKECGHYTKHGHPKELPPKHSDCCKAAEGHDMQCIVDLLTEDERRDYEQAALIALRNACN